MPLTICIAQLNPTVGDMRANAQKIVDAAHAAYAHKAALMLTPELALCGYGADDLLLRNSFNAQCQQALQYIVQATAGLHGLHIVVGHPDGCDEHQRNITLSHRRNAASVLCEGRIVHRYVKQYLPNYQVFDERRYFVEGTQSCTFRIQDVCFGLLICEDAWFDAPADRTREAGAQLLCSINASPFHTGKSLERIERMRQHTLRLGVPFVHADMVGGQDELVFDGGSFALQSDGALAAQARRFSEDMLYLSVEQHQGTVRITPLTPLSTASPATALLSEEDSDPQAEIWHALVLGLRDYMRKNGFSRAILGLSGGIDSALVLAIAVDAIGAEHVRAVMMPSAYTADISLSDAREMAQRLGVQYDEIAIAAAVQAYKSMLSHAFVGTREDITEENIQARVRGNLLMALSNKFGPLVLTTGNKSELATGYCTLYGDMAGGFAVIKDLFKTQVYRLARWRNAHNPCATVNHPIPERIITRAPSAELRPGQTDQDSLPPYEVLDDILRRHVEELECAEDIIRAGHARDVVEKVIRLVRISEYKRRQSPPGTRISHRAFGKDWRMPLTSQYRA